MPRRSRPVSRQPPKNYKLAPDELKQRPLPPGLVAKLKSRVAKSSRSSSEEEEDEEDEEERLEVMGEERNSDTDDEDETDAPQMSQWVDDNGDLYEHVNDEPVRPSVYHSSCKYLTSMQIPVEEGGHSSIHHSSGSDSQDPTRPGISTFWCPNKSKAHVG